MLLLLLFYCLLSSCCCSAFHQIQHIKRKKSCFSFRRSSLKEQKYEAEERTWLDLVNTLDLKPLIRAISTNCKTYHGRQAMLSLIGEADRSYAPSTSSWYKRRALSTNSSSSSSSSSLDGILLDKKNKQSISPTTAATNLPYFTIIQVAESAEDARQEYKLVQEALVLLQNSKIYRNNQPQTTTNHFDDSTTKHSNNNNCCVDESYHNDDDSMPPIYNVQGGKGYVLEDNEEDFKWLNNVVSSLGSNGKISSRDSLDLIDILYAEQSIKKILSLKQWAQNSNIQQLAPGIKSFIHQTLMIEEVSSSIQTVWDTISKSVEIAVVPKGGGREQQPYTIHENEPQQYNYLLKLSSTKFPLLNILEEKERSALQEIEIEKEKASRSSHRNNNKNYIVMKNIPINVVSSVQGKGVTAQGYSDGKFSDLVVPTINIQELILSLIQAHDQKKYLENDIQRQLQYSIFQYKSQIQYALDVVGRIDTLLARASFGYQYDGIYPQRIERAGFISIKSFIHPVLALLEEERTAVVPIDLNLMGDNNNNNLARQALIISGANGGGKTLALKSFGLCATMCKLAIPIPVDKTEVIGGSNSEGPRVDYFDHVLIDIGDSQSVLTGYSTLMAKLNTCSRIIKRIEDYDSEINGKSEICCQQLPLLLSTPHHLVYFLCNMPIIIKEESSSSSKSCLVLFDELGSGTDPESGSAIARAILEYLIEPKKSSICRVIATTHSPQLKLLPSIDHRFRSASVLLQDSSTAIKYTSAAADLYKLPSYKLAYDISGDSYMLGAASRCQPPLPREIIERAADYCLNSTSTISNSNTSMLWNGSQILSVQEAILQDRDAAARARHEAEEELLEIKRLRDATIHLTENFEAQIRRIEYRLSELMKQIKEENNEKYTYDIIGNSLESIRLSKKAVANAADVLAKKGLRLVPPTYKLSVGEIVVVIAQGEWEGETAAVQQVCEETGDIILKPTIGWGSGLLFPDSVVPSSMSDLRTIALKRTDIALWDDYSNTLDEMGGGNQEYSRKEEKGNLKSADKLLSVLSTLRPTTSADHPSAKFTSSRERKMVKAEERKLKKGKKKKK